MFSPTFLYTSSYHSYTDGISYHAGTVDKIGITVFHYYFFLKAMANLISVLADFVKIDDIVGSLNLGFFFICALFYRGG